MSGPWPKHAQASKQGRLRALFPFCKMDSGALLFEFPSQMNPLYIYQLGHPRLHSVQLRLKDAKRIALSLPNAALFESNKMVKKTMCQETLNGQRVFICMRIELPDISYA